MDCVLQFLNDISNNFTGQLLVFVLVVAFTWFVYRTVTTPSNLPPGPRGIPIFGYYPFLDKKQHVTFNKLAQKYGDIFSLYIGSRLVVVLNSYESIKTALKNETFNARAVGEFHRKGQIPGIFNSEGEIWRDYRRFSLTTLRDFGFGKPSMEPRIKEEIQYLLQTVEKLEGKPTDIGNLLRMSISDVICSLMFGKRFDYADENFQYLLKCLNDLLHGTRMVGLGIFFPHLVKIPGVASLIGHHSRSGEFKKLLDEDMQKKIRERCATHISGDEDDFVAAWLTEAERRGPAEGKHMTENHLVQVVLSLFMAGSDTTASTLRWGLLYLMKHPEIHLCVQKEIDEVIGHERTPSITDQELMPYTQATIMELNRIASLVPVANHRALQDTTLMGYFIPKRTIIMPNLWGVHHNSRIFQNPEEFRPERFLDSEGKIVKNENLIPFSIGKRQCLGESLARAELFLYFTCMLQRFTFKKPEGDELCFDYDLAPVTIPRPFRVIAEVRNKIS